MTANNVPQFVRLSNGKMWEIPEGADPQAALRYKEAQLKAKASPQRNTSRRPSGRSTKSKQFASTMHALAFRLEQTNSNPTPIDEIPFNGEPTTQADDVTRTWGDWLNGQEEF